MDDNEFDGVVAVLFFHLGEVVGAAEVAEFRRGGGLGAHWDNNYYVS